MNLALLAALAVAGLVVLAWTIFVVAVARKIRNVAGIFDQVEDVSGDLEECTICAIDWVSTGADLHVIRAEWAEPEHGRGAGTAMVAYYCADHCPGSCDHGEVHAA